MNVNTIFDVPVEVQLEGIFRRLDKESILSFGCCSKTCSTISKSAVMKVFERDGKKNYASGYEHTDELTQAEFNMKIVVLAKKKWRDHKKKPLSSTQYKTLRVIRAEEMSPMQKLYPVDIKLIEFNTMCLTSNDGARLLQKNLIATCVENSLKSVEKGALTLTEIDDSKENSDDLSQKLQIKRNEEQWEFWYQGVKVAGLEQSDPVALATYEEGLLALVLEGKNNIFEVFDTANASITSLLKYEFKNKKIHALLFSKTLELFVTDEKGGIFSFSPFVEKAK